MKQFVCLSCGHKWIEDVVILYPVPDVDNLHCSSCGSDRIRVETLNRGLTKDKTEV